MKFLLECVSCYGKATPDPSLEESSKSAPPALEESRYRSSPPSPRSPSSSTEDSVSASSGVLRRRSRSLSRPGPGDWKPSLHAISEDNVVAPVKPKTKAPEQMNRAASARRSGRRCAASTPRNYSRGRGDSYGDGCKGYAGGATAYPCRSLVFTAGGLPRSGLYCRVCSSPAQGGATTVYARRAL